MQYYNIKTYNRMRDLTPIRRLYYNIIVLNIIILRSFITEWSKRTFKIFIVFVTWNFHRPVYTRAIRMDGWYMKRRDGKT